MANLFGLACDNHMQPHAGPAYVTREAVRLFIGGAKPVELAKGDAIVVEADQITMSLRRAKAHNSFFYFDSASVRAFELPSREQATWVKVAG